MPSPIYKAEFNENGITEVRGTILACYDTNGAGNLLPVGFYQECDSLVQLRDIPYGQTYIQYTT